MARGYFARLHGEDATPPSGRGAEMARILETIAMRGGLEDIGDPVESQRSMRADRPLPGRDGCVDPLAASE